MGEDTVSHDARDAVDTRLHIDRVRNLQVADIQDVVAVVGDEAFAPDRLAAHLDDKAGNEFLRHRQYFNW